MKRFLGAKFTSTVSITLVLFVMGLMTTGALVAAQMAQALREQFAITLTISDGAKEGYGVRMVKDLKKAKYTADAIYVSPDSALKVLQTELGENPAEFLGYNPLPATVELKLKSEYAETDSVNFIIKQLKQEHKRNVSSIEYNSALLDSVNANLRRYAIALAILALALLLICIALIGFTVRLSLHAERFLINTMRLVGATSWFIRKPFIRTHVYCGLIAAFVALLALGGLIYGGMSQGFANVISDCLLHPVPLCILVGTVVCLGILIPAFAAWYSAGHYLRRSVDELYLM